MNFSTLSVAVSCPQPDSAIAKIAIESNLFISLSPLVKDEGILAGISRSKKKSHPEVACQYTQQISGFRNQAEIYR